MQWEDLEDWTFSSTAIDKVVAFLLAFILLFGHFKGVLGFPLSTVVLILLLPFFLFKIMSRRIRVNNGILLLISFTIYRIFIHGLSVSTIAMSWLVVVYVIAALNGMINMRVFLKTVLFISSLNAIIVVFQTVIYYIVGMHINFIPSFLLTDDIYLQAYKQITTGIGDGIYRPSGIFNEPSHYFQYTLPCLTYLLLSPSYDEKKLKYAILITIGILCTTSGMGMFISLGIWSLYCLKILIRRGIRHPIMGMLGVFIAVLTVFWLYNNVSVVRESVLRIFGMGEVGSGAIRGRTYSASLIVMTLSKMQYYFGIGSITTDGIFYSGMYTIIILYGIVGLVMYWLIYLWSVIKLKSEFRVFTLLEAMLLIVSDIFSVQNMVYIFIFIFSGFYIVRKRELNVMIHE